MNKKLISVAVAAVFAAPMANAAADTTLYGRINNALVYTDSDLLDNDEWDVEDYASRLGVKGSEDLGNGMKAIYQIELAMETADGMSTSTPLNGAAIDIDQSRLNIPGDSFGTRLGYVGLTGGFGTAAIGRQWTPYYGSVDKTDIFQIGGSNQAYAGLSRIGDAVSYVTPNFGGFTGALAVIASNQFGGDLSPALPNTGDDTFDIYNVSGDYNNGPLSVGVSYVSFEGDVDRDQWGIGASWKFGEMFTVMGQYEDGDDPLDNSWAIAGQMNFGNNTIAVKYGELNGSDDAELDETIVEATHFFSKRTRVFATYDMTSVDTSESDDNDIDRFGIGIRHDF